MRVVVLVSVLATSVWGSPKYDGGVPTPVRPEWETATFDFEWKHETCDATTRVTSVAVRRGLPVDRDLRLANGLLPIRFVDEYVVTLIHESPLEVCEDHTRPRVVPSHADVPMGSDWSRPSGPRRPIETHWEVLRGAVTVGTPRIELTSRERETVVVHLEEAELELRSPDGTQRRATSHFETTRAANPPRFVRIPVGERFPGAEMTQGSVLPGACDRFSDLGVDAVYLVRGVRVNDRVVDELVLDATFYKRGPGTGLDCQQHASLTDRYAWATFAKGKTFAGGTPDSRITTFGARQLRRFALPAGLKSVQLSFGGSLPVTDALEIDFTLQTVRVVARSPEPTRVVSVDLSHEWERRADDPKRYELRKLERGVRMRTALQGDEQFETTVCDFFQRVLGNVYLPTGEAEALWNARALLCPAATSSEAAPGAR